MSDQWGAPGGPPPEPGAPEGWGPPGSSQPPHRPPPYQQPPGQPIYGTPPPGAPPGAGWEPPPAVYQQQYAAPGPATAQTPGGLKALVIIVSVVKAIPLALLLLVVALFGSLSNSLSDVEGFDEFDTAVDEAFAVVAIIFLVIVAIGAIMLFFHIRTAVKNQLTGLAVLAGIMTAFDLLGFVSTAAGDPADGASVVIMGLVLAGQGAILAWALTARSG